MGNLAKVTCVVSMTPFDRQRDCWQENNPERRFCIWKAPWRGIIDEDGSVDWDTVECSDTNYRGVLLVLHGGLHCIVNANKTFSSIVQLLIAHSKFHEFFRQSLGRDGCTIQDTR